MLIGMHGVGRCHVPSDNAHESWHGFTCAVCSINPAEEEWVRALHRASREQEVAHQSRDLVFYQSQSGKMSTLLQATWLSHGFLCVIFDHVASLQYMRPVLAEKDRLRMRATLYRDSDEYQGNSLRLLLLILRQLTYLVRDGYGLRGSSAKVPFIGVRVSH
jgi:hypothetical protein